MDIKQTAVIITGGASGLGAATAGQLASAGARVTIFDMNTEQVARVASEIGGLGFVVDVRDSQQVQNALEQAQAVHGVARVCINCAGVAPAGRMVGRDGPLPLDAFADAVAINLTGTFNVMRLFTAALIAADLPDDEHGVIINTASIAAFDGQIGQAAYSASKAGVVGMTLPLARELAQFGIRVMTVAPGLMETPMLAGMPDKVVAQLKSECTYPKRFGLPEEYASLCRHIIENSLLNGEVIRLDGAVRMAAK